MSNTILKGFVTVSVIDHLGRIVREPITQPNLILDQGLNNLGSKGEGDPGIYICDLFAYAVKGTHNSANNGAMKEVTTATYSLNVGAETLTRVSGARDFGVGDIGKTIRSANGKEAVIISIDSATVANVRAVGSDILTAFTTQVITLYNTHFVGLDDEVSRTNDYSNIAGENTTTTAGNVRTFKRTFLFETEEENKEEPVGTYTWAGTVLTRNSGARDFVTADVGSYIKFRVSGEYAKISSIVGVSSVNLDRAPVGTNSAAEIDIYGHNTYKHIGFSDEEEAGDNLNIMVRLENSGTATPVFALGANPETPGQQVKVTYTLQFSAFPKVVASKTASFNDPTGAMGAASKHGDYVIEAMSTSVVDSDGGTNVSNLAMEPAYGGTMALSSSAAALVAITPTSNPPDRTPGMATATLEPNEYIVDSFQNTYTGVFPAQDAIANNWRSMGLVDEIDNQFIFTFLFDNAQKKPGTHQLSLTFNKSWNRDLS